MGFLSNMFDELGARRRRLRERLGDRGQSLFEFALLGAFALGSLGLYLRAWMPAAAPWGFAMPFVFIIGYVVLEARRQAEANAGAAIEAVQKRYDWAALLWTLLCGGLAVAALVLAWLAEPPAPPPIDQGWTPPDSAVTIEIAP